MKVAIYTRVSKADGTQDTARQTRELIDFCSQQDWNVIEQVTENISGRKTKREGVLKSSILPEETRLKK